MAVTNCDSLLAKDIQGIDCSNPMVKGAEPVGLLMNRADINFESAMAEIAEDGVFGTFPLLPGKRAYEIFQPGRTPFNGTQQEMAEGTYYNTLTNTVQFVLLNNNADTVATVRAIINGEFVAIIRNKYGKNAYKYQVYGFEAGLHASAMVRELYNDDTLAGWLITLTEEGATKLLYVTSEIYETLITGSGDEAEPV